VSTHPERVADYLQHILDAIERAIGYAAQAANVDAFKSHPLLQDGIVRNMEVIGEAAIKLHKVAPDLATAHLASMLTNVCPSPSVRARHG
jgi:uncharacterized protein with HEPN domain